MKITAVLFDLDGTITESGPGIVRSVQYALEKLGRPEPDEEKLRVFVGPPLLDSFMSYAGFNRETAEQAIKLYRERYAVRGIFENALYPGVKEMLRDLQKEGFRLAIASSKPEQYVQQILAHFGIDRCFETAVGSSMSEADAGKPHIITEALRRLSLLDRKNEAVMVGDREHDVFGAKKAGISCIGVTYGYGSREELEKAGAACIAESAAEIPEVLRRFEGSLSTDKTE